MNYKKLSSMIYALLIVLSVVAPITFVGNIASATITGRPNIWFYNGSTDTSGDPLHVPAVLNRAKGEYLAIDINPMTITGAQIWIWFSKTGGAVIEPEDAVFLGPIYMGDVTGTDKNMTVKVYYPFSKYVSDDNPSTDDVEIRVKVGRGWINITQLPGIFETGAVYWIKITDVDPNLRYSIPSSDVAVSTNRIVFDPVFYAFSEVGGDLVAVPDETIAVGGFALSTGGLYNITLLYYSKTKVVYYNVSAEKQTEPASDINPEWTWTGFKKEFSAPDLELKYPDTTKQFRVQIVNATNANDVKATFYFDQPPREVYFPSDGTTTPREHKGDYSNIIVVETGKKYNITLANFPSDGYVEIKFNGTWAVEPSKIELNATGGIYNATITILYNVPESGIYNMTIKDNHGVIYWFLVNVTISPGISIEPNKGYVGDTAVVSGTMFNDYVGTRINIWFQVNSTHYRLVANFTPAAASWSVSITIPHATKGNKSVVATIDLGGNKKYEQKANIEDTTKSIASTLFEVLPKLVVEPSEFPADYGKIVYVEGTGFDPDESYKLAVDNQFLQDGIKANGTGDLYVTLIGAGFAPGLHVVALYESITKPAFYALFTVTPSENATTLDDIMAKLEKIESMLQEISGTLLVVNDNVAYLVTETQSISLSIEDLKVMITQLGDNIELKLDDINSSLAKLIIKKGDEVVGTLTTKLSDLDAKITDVSNNVVTISTVLGDVKTTVNDLKNGQAEIKDLIKTKSGDIVAVIDTAKGNILAELSTVEDLIKNGVKVDTENILAKIDELKSNVGTASDKLDALAASLDNVKSSLDDIKSGLDDIKSSVNSVKSSVEDAKSSVSSAISSAADDLKTTIEDKANSVSGSVSTYGLVNLILILIAIILTAYVGFFHKKE